MLTPGEETHASLDGGWVLPEPAPRKQVHTRSIVCRSFSRGDGQIDIDGRFIDTRCFDYESDFRGPCAAGSALHNMQLRLTVDRSRHISAVQLAMVSTPYTTCSGVEPNFQDLLGLSMGRGFKKALRERLGGVMGCTHVLALLDAMAAAAVQSFTSAGYAPRPPGAPEPVRMFKLETLQDSCHSYRNDGPVMAQLREREQRRQAAKGQA